MKPMEHMVEEALRDPCAAARAHAASGGRVIGFFGSDIPVELIYASNAFALRLPSFVASSAAADKYLESSFSAEARSIAEQYLHGRFNFLSDIILPRSNDSAQRLYYYLAELRARGLASGPTPRIYDLAKIPRDTSLAHSRWATQRLAVEIGVQVESLAAAMNRRSRRRALIADAAKLRIGRGARGSFMERALRSADFCDVDAFDQVFAEWLSALPPFTSRPRLLLAGSVPPDDRLHVAVEAAGGNIIAEVGEHASCAVPIPISDIDASYSVIADYYQSLQVGSRAFSDRAAATLNTAQSAAADGVIIWLTEEEDALIWDLPAQLSALAKADVAALPLVRRRWDGEDGTFQQIGVFTRSLQVSG